METKYTPEEHQQYRHLKKKYKHLKAAEATELIEGELGGIQPTLRYMHWVRDCYYRSHEYYRVIKRPEFLTRLANVDFDDATSMREFRRFLDRPKIEKIAVGMLGNRVIALSTHSQHMIVDDPATTGPAARIDNRRKVYETILGVWKDAASRRAGNHSEEGYVSEETMTIRPRAPLEVFCEIGTLYFREAKPPEDVPNTSHRRWLPTNYVLVINIDDDSIWMIWNKSISDGEGDYRAAEPDYQPWSLPGCPESPIYIAQLADGFAELGDQKPLSFRSVLPSSHFEIVQACYADGGGLRRLNDWRSKGKRDPPRSVGSPKMPTGSSSSAKTAVEASGGADT